MTDTRKDYHEWWDNSDDSDHWSEPAWQACQSLNDKRIQQLLAVIAKQKEVLTIVNDTVTHGAGAFIKDSLLHTNIEEAIAIKPQDVELVGVMEATGGGMLYTIKTKE